MNRLNYDECEVAPFRTQLYIFAERLFAPTCRAACRICSVRTLIRDFAANEKFKLFMSGISFGYRAGCGLKSLAFRVDACAANRKSYRSVPSGPAVIGRVNALFTEVIVQ